MSIEVGGIDHVYVAVTDLARSEAFYDGVMRLLGFKKGTAPIAGEPHFHYFNQVTQYSLRPAKRTGPHCSEHQFGIAGGSAEPAGSGPDSDGSCHHPAATSPRPQSESGAPTAVCCRHHRH